MERKGRDYWAGQLAEYWDSGLTIREYSELKELSYESVRRWIQLLNGPVIKEPIPVELVEVKPPVPSGSGVSLKAGGIDIHLEKGFDGATLLALLKLLGEAPCSASAAR